MATSERASTIRAVKLAPFVQWLARDILHRKVRQFLLRAPKFAEAIFVCIVASYWKNTMISGFLGIDKPSTWLFDLPPASHANLK
jgi:hypothetical protein